MVEEGNSPASIGQLRRGVLEYCVMAMLETTERYGFDLVRELAQRDGLVTGEGTVYPLLARLRREGLVETTWRESSAGPPRRYYRLSTRGGEALNRFRDEWSKFRSAVDAALEAKDG